MIHEGGKRYYYITLDCPWCPKIHQHQMAKETVWENNSIGRCPTAKKYYEYVASPLYGIGGRIADHGQTQCGFKIKTSGDIVVPYAKYKHGRTLNRKLRKKTREEYDNWNRIRAERKKQKDAQ
jgi:hypothetical protein